jgi:hypothetical protein
MRALFAVDESCGVLDLLDTVVPGARALIKAAGVALIHRHELFLWEGLWFRLRAKLLQHPDKTNPILA